MARVVFTRNIQRHVECPTTNVPANTVAEALDAVFASNPVARGYVLDDQGGLRKHMIIFIDGQTISDRTHLTDAIGPDSEIYVMQALSGG